MLARSGDVVHVVSDRIAELGAEDGDGFCRLTRSASRTRSRSGARHEFVNDRPAGASRRCDGLPKVRGITVNTVHGNERSIAAVRQRFSPQVESMEGAAFMYACLMHAGAVRPGSRGVQRRRAAQSRGAGSWPKRLTRCGRGAGILDEGS